MFPLFETLCIDHGKIMHLQWHQQRYERSCMKFYGIIPSLALAENIVIPNYCIEGCFKMKISYNNLLQHADFESYKLKDIELLHIVKDDEIEYSLKFTDRTYISRLLNQMKAGDDILIIKKGMVTDTSFCNIVFFDGKNWITPSTPLLKGTARERLLFEKKIKSQPISLNDIRNFQSFKLINAMRNFDMLSPIDVDRIII